MPKTRSGRSSRQRRRNVPCIPERLQRPEPNDLPSFVGRVVRLVEYELTYDALDDPRGRRLPQVDQQRIDAVIERFMERPGQSVEALEQLVADFPNFERLYNYLGVAYEHASRFDEARQLMRQTYERFPDYLFAKLSYARLCLLEGRYNEVADVFEHKFDLCLLYPHRRRFHITEFTSFHMVMGEYHHAIGDKSQAQRHYEALQQAAPDCPDACRLRALLRPHPLRKLLQETVRRLRDAPVETPAV